MTRSNPLPVLLALGAIVLIGLNLAGLLHLPLQSAGLAGPARVVDGDTLDLDRHRVRLFGIDAPESAQTCERDGAAYACGQEAKRYLEALIGGRPVACRARDADRYGRTVAVCTAGGEDLNAAMVRAGWALAYRRYSTDYVPAEAAARRDGRGLWAGRFEPPADWRHHHSGG